MTEQTNPALQFLAGDGRMAAMMRTMDWSDSPLGTPDAWPTALKTTIRQLLTTSHPMFIWWGPRLIQFYNDAYSESLGPERHPSALGQEGRECWEEIWPIIGPQIEQVMSGGEPTWHENALVPITRNGRREDVYWTYSYSPINDRGAASGVGGVLVVCTETTADVQSARRVALEKDRLEGLLNEAPAFMAMLRGPEHRFEFANPAYIKLLGNRPLIGLTLLEAVPELSGQGYLDLLAKVYQSGESMTVRDSPLWLVDPVSGLPVQGYVDFVYQPVRDVEGRVNGIFVQGTDVSDRKWREDGLRETVARVMQASAVTSALVSRLKSPREGG